MKKNEKKMSELITKARAKMAEECTEHPELVPVEEHLTDICKTDKIAQQILDEDKTLLKAFDEIRKVARERQANNCGFVPEKEGYEIVDKYFGIDEKANTVDIADFLE